jgi:pseudomonalisin/xanthomonalisin
MQAGEAVSIAVSLQVPNKAALDAYTANVIAGKAAPLSSAQFLSRFAPTPAQVNAVVSYLQQSGFVNIKVAANNLVVTADGTAGAAQAAFNVSMQHFTTSQGRAAYANINDPVVPASLGNIVLSVHGLQNIYTMQPQMLRASQKASGTEVGHSPTAWPTIYNATGIPNAANTTIGIISAGSMTQTLKDLATFVSQAGFASPTVSTVQVGSAGTSTSGTPEWDIDSQDSLGAAGGVVKSMVFYVATSLSDANLTSDFNEAVSANVAKVINVSLGECETSASSAGMTASVDQIFETAVAQGQTFSVSTGDSGAYECGGSKAAQSYPAVSPYAIAVGGTTLYTTSGAWTSETVWSCTSASNCSRDGGTGGGISSTEAAPSWQTSSGVLGTSTKRGVPDIAFDANPESGATIVLDGKSAQYGGTSLASPIFVGFWARIQSANSNSLVFPATALYKYGVANESTLFHDITSGENGSSSTGYSAKTGWDYVSGFGSINVGAFSTFITNNSGF